MKYLGLGILIVLALMALGWMQWAKRPQSGIYSVSSYGVSIGSLAEDVRMLAGADIESHDEAGRLVLSKRGRIEATIDRTSKVHLITSDRMNLTSNQGVVYITLGSRIDTITSSIGKPYAQEEHFVPTLTGYMEIYRYRCLDAELTIFVDTGKAIRKLVASR